MLERCDLATARLEDPRHVRGAHRAALTCDRDRFVRLRASAAHQWFIDPRASAPPSTARLVPVMNDAASEQRKTITRPISAGSAMRPERNLGGSEGAGLLEVLRRHGLPHERCVGEAGKNAVDADCLSRVVDCHRARQTLHAGLRGTVRRDTGHRHAPEYRACRHDGASARFAEERNGGAADEIGAFEARVDDGVPVGDRELIDGAVDLDARDARDGIQAAEAFPGGLDHALGVVPHRDVALHRDAVLDVREGLREPRTVAIRGDDAISGLGEQARARAPDAAGRARDQGDLHSLPSGCQSNPRPSTSSRS